MATTEEKIIQREQQLVRLREKHALDSLTAPLIKAFGDVIVTNPDMVPGRSMTLEQVSEKLAVINVKKEELDAQSMLYECVRDAALEVDAQTFPGRLHFVLGEDDKTVTLNVGSRRNNTNGTGNGVNSWTPYMVLTCETDKDFVEAVIDRKDRGTYKSFAAIIDGWGTDEAKAKLSEVGVSAKDVFVETFGATVVPVVLGEDGTWSPMETE